MTIREATRADAARVAEMAARFLAETRYGGLLTTTPAIVATLLDRVLTEGVGYVAERELLEPDGVRTVLVGMIGLVVRTNPISDERWADELVWWVDPEHRTTRAGPLLLHAAETWARDCCRGLRGVTMIAPAGSDLGAYYERRGYTLIETVYEKRLTDL